MSMNVDGLAAAVKTMRDYQKEYFKVSARCSKSGFHPDLVNEKRKLLSLSKAAEKVVDEMVVEALKSTDASQKSLFS